MVTTAVPNQQRPFVDWYLLPEAYSLPLVETMLDRYGLGPGQTVLDPFAGPGTTVVTARLRGVNGLGVEVNPFLAFAARVKSRLADGYDRDALARDVAQLLEAGPPPVPPDLELPAMPRVERWISPPVAAKVLALRARLDALPTPAHRDLARLALAAVLRESSNTRLSPHAFGSRVERPGARCVLVTGASAHSGVLVPVPTITAELGARAGYQVEAIETLRARRSSSHRFVSRESAVILRRG